MLIRKKEKWHFVIYKISTFTLTPSELKEKLINYNSHVHAISANIKINNCLKNYSCLGRKIEKDIYYSRDLLYNNIVTRFILNIYYTFNVVSVKDQSYIFLIFLYLRPHQYYFLFCAPISAYFTMKEKMKWQCIQRHELFSLINQKVKIYL